MFVTVRHRTVRSKGALSQDTARLMVFKLVVAAAKTWRRLKGGNQLPKVVQGVTFRNGVRSMRWTLKTRQSGKVGALPLGSTDGGRELDMKQARKKHGAAFKAKVVLAAIKAEDLDIVVGGRHSAAGGLGDWEHRRVTISNVAARLARLDVTANLTDPVSGLFMPSLCRPWRRRLNKWINRRPQLCGRRSYRRPRCLRPLWSSQALAAFKACGMTDAQARAMLNDIENDKIPCVHLRY